MEKVEKALDAEDAHDVHSREESTALLFLLWKR